MDPPGITASYSGDSGGDVEWYPSEQTITVPVAEITGVTQAATAWYPYGGYGWGLPSAGAARAPVGTSFGFTLGRPGRVRFLFTHTVPGRRVGRRCVPLTSRNRRRARCQRTGGVALSFQAHAGRTRLRFGGRIDRKRKLAPGRYKLAITATTNGRTSRPAILRFRILA